MILLTHPRTARDPALHAVARRPGDRVFALTVGDDGRAELAEWGAAGPVPVRSFRVDLAAAEAAKVDEPRPRAAAAPLPVRLDSAWTGDVEPVAFPFRPGLVAEPAGLTFDADAEWLVAAGPNGVLHGLALGGAPPEVLPRAFHGGAVLKQVDAVLPLAGGVAVCGRLDPVRTSGVTMYPTGSPVMTSGASDDPPGRVFAVAHYDRAARRVKVHRLRAATGPASWTAYPELNCVVVTSPPDSDNGLCVVDLTTAEQYVFSHRSFPRDRIRAAIDRLSTGPAPPLTLTVRTSPPSDTDSEARAPYLRLRGNSFSVQNADREWAPFEPLRDGKPLLGGTDVIRAQLAGDTLALALRRGGERTLTFFHGPRASVLGEAPHPHSAAPFALSPCGRRVARVTQSRTVVVADVPGTGPALAAAAPAGVHNNLAVRVDANPFRLLVRVGGFVHQFQVHLGELFHMVVTHSAAHPTWPAALRPPGAAPLYDPARFPLAEAVAAGRWTAVTDRLGQVLLFAGGPGLVASVLVRRELAAVWAPGGAFWGSTALIGGPPTRDAARVIGAAIDAVGRG